MINLYCKESEREEMRRLLEQAGHKVVWEGNVGGRFCIQFESKLHEPIPYEAVVEKLNKIYELLQESHTAVQDSTWLYAWRTLYDLIACDSAESSSDGWLVKPRKL